MQASTSYGDIIAFDVEPLNKKDFSATAINQIQQTLHISEDVYKILGVVEYKPANNHFVAHVKRANSIWETYDDLTSEVIRSRKCATSPMLIFGVFYVKS